MEDFVKEQKPSRAPKSHIRPMKKKKNIDYAYQPYGDSDENWSNFESDS